MLKADAEQLMLANAYPAISFLPMAPLDMRGSDVITHASAIIRDTTVRLHPCIFKIGITWRPKHRWLNSAYGYAHEGFSSMAIMALAPAHKARGFEETLISQWRDHRGCQTEKPGGEGFSPTDRRPCCLYIVSVSSEVLTAWRRAK